MTNTLAVPLGVTAPGRDGAVVDVAVGDRAVGDRTVGDRAVGDGTVGDRAVGDRAGGDDVADLGDVVDVLAAEAVVRVLARKRVPLAPLRAGTGSNV